MLNVAIHTDRPLKFEISIQLNPKFSLSLVALPFPKREGEVGCEALSSSPREHWQSNNMETETAETQHLNEASAKQ